MSKKLLFIYNPKSGKGLIKSNLSDITDVFVREGFEVSIHSTQSQGDATQKVRACAHEFDRIVCAGGDGTLDEVVTGVMESEAGCAIGYIPAGSTNDFGNSIGLGKGMLADARTAAGKHSFLCDIGKFGTDYFVYVAAFGIFTNASYSTDQDLKNMLGHAAYVLQAISTLGETRRIRMQVEHDGKVFFDEFIFGMVTNSKSVGGTSAMLPEKVSLDDGLFEVTLIKTPTNPIELNEVAGFFAGINHDTEMVYHITTSRIKFTSMDKVRWALDGEFGGEHESIVIQNLQKAIEIIA
ncbi:MAG: YegS/Rv2252/BmrU family lipid kinase [Lachnospiraceae bacterium]|nr:YegS/Rv2252/BmrU family lipid kinase [Lachnospiraceae bacterium]